MRKITLFVCFLLSITAVFAASEIENTTAAFDNPDFVLDANGVTCKCDNASFGDTGTIVINGVSKTFTKRTRLELTSLHWGSAQVALTCTSGITDMSGLFRQWYYFNQDIGSWDVSNVTDMSEMFIQANAFNQNLNYWDVSKVTDMNKMFRNAYVFNGDIGNWNVSEVKDMWQMFFRAYRFNKDIGSWNVSNVERMNAMFNEASDFNKELGNWNVSNVTEMSLMFQGASNFNQNLNNWCVTNLLVEPSNFGTNSALQASNKPVWGTCPTPAPSCTPPVGNTVSASATQVGTDVVFTLSAPAGVTVAYSGDASGTAENGDTVTVSQSALTSGSASIVLDSAYLTADNTCSTALGGIANTYEQTFCNPPKPVDVTTTSAQVGTDVVFTINAPAGVTVEYTITGGATGTAVNGDTVTISQSALTSGTASITIDSAYLTSDNSCTTIIGTTYNGTFCNAPKPVDVTATSAQIGTNAVFTLSAPAGVTVAYSGDASGTGENGDTVTVSQSALTSGSASIVLESAYLTADNTCSTSLGGVANTYEQTFCNPPKPVDVTATSAQVGTDVVFTLAAPAGVTVDYTITGGVIGTAVNGDEITLTQTALDSGVEEITLNKAYLTDSNPVCETTLNKVYEQEYCNPPNAADVYATSAQVGTDIEFTIYAPLGVTVTYFYQNMNGPDSANATAVNGDIIRIQQDALTSGEYYFVIGEARLTSDEFCYTTVAKEYFQPFCNAPQISDTNLIPSVSGDDIIFTVDASPNVTVEITSDQGSITAIDGDVITFIDGNLIHSVVFSATITGAYLTSDSGCAADYDPDREISFTVPRSRHPLAIDDVHTLDQTKSRSIRPLKRGTNDSDPNGLALRVKTINGVAVLGGPQIIPVPNGELTIDDENLMWFKSDNSFVGDIQFPYEIINTDRYEDDGVVFVTVEPLENQPTVPTAVDDYYAMQQGTTLEVKPLSKGIDDNDPNDLNLYVTAIDGTPITAVGQVIPVTHGEVEVLNAEATEFGFTPNPSFSGTTTFDYTITSLIKDTDTAAITVVVDPLPTGPTNPTATDDSYAMEQGTTLELKPLTKGTDDSDPNDLELNIVSINSQALTGSEQIIRVPNGLVNIDVNGVITFTPHVTFTNGTVTFPYTITNTLNLTDSGTQNITVTTAVVSNGAPTATDDNYTTDQGDERRIRPLTKGVNDSDPENRDLFIYSIAGEEIDYDNLPQTIDVLVASTIVGTVIFEDENDITFTPASATKGTVTFPYVIVNEEITPAITVGVTNSASANQIIEVIPVAGGSGNPVANDDLYSLKQGTSREIKPLTRHYDDYDPNGLALAITFIGGEEVTGSAQDIIIPNATISINADDEIFFIPDSSFSGTITFAYIIKNTNNDTTTGMVTMIVDAVRTSNRAPRAIDDVYTINKNAKKRIAPLTTGERDKDPNGEVLSLAYINGEEVYGGNQIIEVPNGKLEVNNVNDITFVPNKDYLGVAMFSYEISNETGISDTGLQTINILESNALDTNSFVISPQDFSVYPNPSKGNVFVNLTSSLNTKASITLFDVTGKTVHSSNRTIVEGQNTLDFKFKVSAGILFLKVSTNNQSIVRKLIIK